MSSPASVQSRKRAEMPCRARFSAWSFTVATEPRPSDEALIVCCLPVANLGIDDLVAEVAEQSGAKEAREWRQSRAREFVIRLRDALRLHVSNAELIVHAEDGAATERVQVIVAPAAEPAQAARLEEELSNRVDAIRRRTWVIWCEGLRITMAALRELDEAPDDKRCPADAEARATSV